MSERIDWMSRAKAPRACRWHVLTHFNGSQDCPKDLMVFCSPMVHMRHNVVIIEAKSKPSAARTATLLNAIDLLPALITTILLLQSAAVHAVAGFSSKYMGFGITYVAGFDIGAVPAR